MGSPLMPASQSLSKSPPAGVQSGLQGSRVQVKRWYSCDISSNPICSTSLLPSLSTGNASKSSLSTTCKPFTLGTFTLCQAIAAKGAAAIRQAAAIGLKFIILRSFCSQKPSVRYICAGWAAPSRCSSFPPNLSPQCSQSIPVCRRPRPCRMVCIWSHSGGFPLQ